MNDSFKKCKSIAIVIKHFIGTIKCIRFTFIQWLCKIVTYLSCQLYHVLCIKIEKNFYIAFIDDCRFVTNKYQNILFISKIKIILFYIERNIIISKPSKISRKLVKNIAFILIVPKKKKKKMKEKLFHHLYYKIDSFLHKS